MKNILIIILFIVLPFVSFSQTKKQSTKIQKVVKNEDKAHQNLEEAHICMDKKEYSKAEKLILESLDLSEDEIKYTYELAWNYFLSQDYKKAIKWLTPMLSRKDIPADYYQLLGNAYDEMGDEGQAIIIYEKGLERFPNAGCLFLERGNLSLKKKDYSRALYYYEKGIEKDPTYPSNYYRAALIFLKSSEEVWGVMYGEIFMNLGRGSDRAKEISKLLYDTYYNEITFSRDGVNVSFNDPTIIYSDSKYRANFFPDNFEKSISKACKGFKGISIESLSSIRKKFILSFYNSNYGFKNVLFDYHKLLIEKGYFDAYNYWLFGYGNTNESGVWINDNKKTFDDFMSWFKNNPFPVNQSNVFSRYNME